MTSLIISLFARKKFEYTKRRMRKGVGDYIYGKEA